MNLKKGAFLLVTLCMATMMFGQNQPAKLKKFKPYKGISLSLPSDFVEMKEEDIAQRYFTYKKPSMVYTDPNLETDVDINVTKNFWGEEDINMLKGFYKSTIFMGHKKIEIIQDTVVEMKGREYGLIEFTGGYPSSKRSLISYYTALVFTVIDNRIVVVSFRCRKNRKDYWQNTALSVIGSVKMKSNVTLLEETEKDAEQKGVQKEEQDKLEAGRNKTEQKVSPRPNFKNPEVNPEKRKGGTVINGTIPQE